MTNACPLNFKQVDSNLSRLAALGIASLVVWYLLSINVYILYFLLIDFFMKLFLCKGNSPITIVAAFIKEILKIKENFTDSGAKKLAGMFGMFFVFLLIVSHFIGFWSLSLGIAVIFLTCSLLDVFFDFCIACKIYFIIKKIYPNFMNNL